MDPTQEKVGLGQYLKNTLKQGLQVFKNPLKLLPTVVIGIVWLVIGILSSLWQPFPWPMQIASFLSYAEGGLFGGVFGAVGGIVGKVVMAVFINSAILPLFEKKPPFVGVAGGLKGMFTSMSKDAASGIAPLLSGLGLALLFYTFMNINQCWQNSMVGLVSLVMLLQAMGNKSSFIIGFIFSAARTLTKGKVPTFLSVTRFLTGMTIGFTMAVGLSLVGLHWCFWLALFFGLVGIILMLVLKTQQQAAEIAAAKAAAAPQGMPPVPGQATPPMPTQPMPPVLGQAAGGFPASAPSAPSAPPMPPTPPTGAPGMMPPPPPFGAPPAPNAPTGQVPPPYHPQR
jgi:hypothetical protein